jgi:hypothetical protein
MRETTHTTTRRPPQRGGTAIALWCAVLVALAAAPGAAGSPQNHLTPILDCIDIGGDGSITAHFGYTNSWTNVPAGKPPPGPQNWFLPAPADRGQPSQFQPGTFSDVFTVTFTPTSGNPNIEWRLSDANGEFNSAIADASSARCTPVPAAGLDSPWPVLLSVVGLGAALAVRQRRRTREG